MNGPRILIVDLESSYNVGQWFGSLYNVNVPLAQLLEAPQVISFAAKWLGDKKTEFRSIHHDGSETMIKRIWHLLDEADIVCHYNGKAFDIKHFNREFVEAGYGPPSPFQQIDLLQVVRRNFKFVSNKLQHVATELGLTGKLGHTGFSLWQRCMAGDAKAWKLMRRYNVQDVKVTEELYRKLLPWIPAHPHGGLWTGDKDGCPRCGSTSVQKRGYARTELSTFQQFACMNCGGWFRSTKSISRMDTKAA